MSTNKIIERDGPRSYIRRVGDWVQEGGNNTIIILGTDRAKSDGPATTSDGLGHVSAAGGGRGTGTIHMIAGRKDRQGNPDFGRDDSFMYLTMKSNIDRNLGIDSIPSSRNNAAAAAIKSDNVRLVFRDTGDFRVSNDDGSSYIVFSRDYLDSKIAKNLDIDVGGVRLEVHDSNKVKLGPLAAALQDLAETLNESFSTATTVSQTGNLGAPVPFAGSDLQMKVKLCLETWVQKWIDGQYVKGS